MADVYTNDLRIREQEVGANSGAWGGYLNTSLSNLAESWSYGTEALADSAAQTLTLADGASDELRSFYVKLTGTLSQATTVTIAPNTISKSWMVENATSGGYAVTISQGSGANVTVANGNVKMIATDGAGAGAVVYDLFTDLELAGGATITVDDNSNVLTLKSTDADENSGPRLALTRDSGSPADDDYIGLISFNADDDGGNLTRFGYMVGQITDASNGSEDGLLDFYTTATGTETRTLTLVSGKAGIGSASPTYKLNVQGSSTETNYSFAATVPAITLTNNSATDDTYSALAFSDTDGGGNWTAAMVGKTVGQSANMGEIQFWTRNASSFSQKMAITNNGGVGIGTTTPSAELHVKDASAGSRIIVQASASGQDADIQFLTADDGQGWVTFHNGTDNKGAIKYNHASDYMSFRTNGTDNRLYIDSGGNVGMSTASPTSNAGWNRFLEIAGGSSNAVILDGTDGQEAGIGAVDSLYIDCYGHSTATNNNIIFRTQSSNDSHSGTEQMRINSLGQVLIGATAGTYTHDNGLRVYTGEVGSNYLDAALSLQGSGGDFYAQNWVGGANVGFGLLAVFSGTTDYLIYSYRASSSNTNILQLYQNGDVQVHGAFSKASGSFRITHPLPAKKDTHDLVHSFIEGPQADLIYRGAVDLVGGSATVNLDTAGRMTEGTFVLLNTNTQCFTSNESGWTAIKGSVSGNILTITAQDNTCTDTISWMVVGERHDQHMKDTDWTDSDGRVITEPLQQDLSNETTEEA